MKFKHYLLLPTSLVIIWWLLGLPVLIFPDVSFFGSNLYSNVITGGSLIITGVLNFVVLVILLAKKQYKNVLGLFLGSLIAAIIAIVSLVLLFGLGGVMAS